MTELFNDTMTERDIELTFWKNFRLDMSESEKKELLSAYIVAGRAEMERGYERFLQGYIG